GVGRSALGNSPATAAIASSIAVFATGAGSTRPDAFATGSDSREARRPANPSSVDWKETVWLVRDASGQRQLQRDEDGHQQVGGREDQPGPQARRATSTTGHR